MNKFVFIFYVLFSFSNANSSENECSSAVSGNKTNSEQLLQSISGNNPSLTTLDDLAFLASFYIDQDLSLASSLNVLFGDTVTNGFKLYDQYATQEDFSIKSRQALQRKLSHNFRHLNDNERQDHFFSTLMILETYLKLSAYENISIKSQHESDLFDIKNPIQVSILMNIIRIGEMASFIPGLNKHFAKTLKHFRHSVVHGYILDMKIVYEIIDNIKILFSLESSYQNFNFTPLSYLIMSNSSFFTKSTDSILNLEDFRKQTFETVNNFTRVNRNGEYIQTRASAEIFAATGKVPNYEITDFLRDYTHLFFHLGPIFASQGFNSEAVVKHEKNIYSYFVIRFGEIASLVNNMKSEIVSSKIGETEKLEPFFVDWIIQKLNVFLVKRVRNDLAHIGLISNEELSGEIFSLFAFSYFTFTLKKYIGPYKKVQSDYGSTSEDIYLYTKDINLSVKAYYYLTNINSEGVPIAKVIDSSGLTLAKPSTRRQIYKDLFLNYMLERIKADIYWFFFDRYIAYSDEKDFDKRFEEADIEVTKFVEENFLTENTVDYLFKLFMAETKRGEVHKLVSPGVLKKINPLISKIFTDEVKQGDFLKGLGLLLTYNGDYLRTDTYDPSIRDHADFIPYFIDIE